MDPLKSLRPQAGHLTVLKEEVLAGLLAELTQGFCEGSRRNGEARRLRLARWLGSGPAGRCSCQQCKRCSKLGIGNVSPQLLSRPGSRSQLAAADTP